MQSISPLGIAPEKKTHKARARWYRGPFRRFISSMFLKTSMKKERREAIQKYIYKCITANTSAIWQHAAQNDIITKHSKGENGTTYINLNIAKQINIV